MRAFCSLVILLFFYATLGGCSVPSEKIRAVDVLPQFESDLSELEIDDEAGRSSDGQVSRAELPTSGTDNGFDSRKRKTGELPPARSSPLLSDRFAASLVNSAPEKVTRTRSESIAIPTEADSGTDLPHVFELMSNQESLADGPPVGDAEAIPTPTSARRIQSTDSLQLEDVINAVYASYPLLEAAYLSRDVAAGEQLSSQGAFDFKLKGGATSGPLGFYQTQRFGAGASQPLFSGGELFGGYKLGRGNFQPWFGERETNNGGEFSLGIAIPLSQDRRIDARRTALYQATYGRDAVEPDIQTQVIAFVWESSSAYWQWVAAGRSYQISLSLLELAQQRNGPLKIRVEEGDLASLELTDNQRLVVSRQAALIDSQRKLKQTAIKLSLFLRTSEGQPIVPSAEQLPATFPSAAAVDTLQMANDIQLALANRPELRYLDFKRMQLDADLAQARNLYLPEVDAVLFASKDVGGAASSKGDKTPFEFEAALRFSVPLQRRKAIGKIQTIEGKLGQLLAKMDFTRDKISTDVQNVYAAQQAAFERITRAQESLELTRTMEKAEREKFDAGSSNLLLVNLRELATAAAAQTVLKAQLDYVQAQVDFRAAVALDSSPGETP